MNESSEKGELCSWKPHAAMCTVVITRVLLVNTPDTSVLRANRSRNVVFWLLPWQLCHDYETSTQGDKPDSDSCFLWGRNVGGKEFGTFVPLYDILDWIIFCLNVTHQNADHNSDLSCQNVSERHSSGRLFCPIPNSRLNFHQEANSRENCPWWFVLFFWPQGTDVEAFLNPSLWLDTQIKTLESCFQMASQTKLFPFWPKRTMLGSCQDIQEKITQVGVKIADVRWVGSKLIYSPKKEDSCCPFACVILDKLERPTIINGHLGRDQAGQCKNNDPPINQQSPGGQSLRFLEDRAGLNWGQYSGLSVKWRGCKLQPIQACRFLLF